MACALCAGLFLTACAGFQTTSAKLLITTTQTVDAAMKGWATYAVANKLTDAQQAPVRDAYSKYQAAEKVAEDAYIAAVATGDQSPWTAANAVLQAAAANLQSIIQAFNIK